MAEELLSADRPATYGGNDFSEFAGGTYGAVPALAADDDVLYAGGRFTTIGGVAADRIARWDGSAWSAI